MSKVNFSPAETLLKYTFKYQLHTKLHMGLESSIQKNPVFGISDKVRLNPVCSAIEAR